MKALINYEMNKEKWEGNLSSGVSYTIFAIHRKKRIVIKRFVRKPAQATINKVINSFEEFLFNMAANHTLKQNIYC
jgi:hypothetical protein